MHPLNFHKVTLITNDSLISNQSNQSTTINPKSSITSNKSSLASTIPDSFTTYDVTSPLPDPLSINKMWTEFHAIQLPGIVVSLLILLIIIAVCEIVYRLVIHNVIVGLFKSVILDFVAAGEATVISWELITIFHGYGLPVWTMFAFIFMMIKYYRYRLECVACPYSHVQSYLKGYLTLKESIARICSQFLGGSVFFHWHGNIWDLGLTPIHIGRSYWTSFGKCASWLAVPSWLGFIYEFTGSLVCGVFGSLIFDFELFPSITIHARILTSTLITVSLVLVAFHHTGGFFQPLLAFARTFGCVGVLREVTILDHVVVYWLGATLGAVLSMYLVPLIRPWVLKCSSKRSAGLAKSVQLKGIEESRPLFDDDADDDDNVVYERKDHTR